MAKLTPDGVSIRALGVPIGNGVDENVWWERKLGEISFRRGSEPGGRRAASPSQDWCVCDNIVQLCEFGATGSIVTTLFQLSQLLWLWSVDTWRDCEARPRLLRECDQCCVFFDCCLFGQYCHHCCDCTTASTGQPGAWPGDVFTPVGEIRGSVSGDTNSGVHPNMLRRYRTAWSRVHTSGRYCGVLMSGHIVALSRS